MRYKKLFTHVKSHANAVSLLESGEQRYIKSDQQHNDLAEASGAIYLPHNVHATI